MAKGSKKKGPPYLDDPGCKYIVIIDPCGMDSTKDRSQEDVNRLGSWIVFMLREQSDRHGDVSVEAVYMRRTQNEVVIQLSQKTDLVPLLGEHKWPEFLKWRPNSNSPTASYIFEYNYRVNGKPDNHNWADYYPDSKPPFPALNVEHAYPRAHYANSTRFGHLRSLILPLPQERERTPTPPPKDDLFTPYEPPAHHPTHSKLYPEVKAENSNTDVAVGNSGPEPKVKTEEEGEGEEERSRPPGNLVEKYDPYDEEETARRALRSDGPAEDPVTQTPAVTVKEEEISSSVNDYQPSNALLESFAMLEQSRVTPGQQEVGVKNEPEVRDPESDYQPSDAFLESLAAQLNYGGQDSASKVEPRQDRHLSKPRHTVVKTEPDATNSSSGYTPSDALAQAFHQSQAERPRPHSTTSSAPTVKNEPVHSTDRVSIPVSDAGRSTVSRDPRRRPPSNVPKRPKEEEDSLNANLGKKIKTERY